MCMCRRNPVHKGQDNRTNIPVLRWPRCQAHQCSDQSSHSTQPKPLHTAISPIDPQHKHSRAKTLFIQLVHTEYYSSVATMRWLHNLFVGAVSSPALAHLALGCIGAVLIMRTLQKKAKNPTRVVSSRFSRPAAHVVSHWLRGEPVRPTGMTFKDFFYECYKSDVEYGAMIENPAIPRHVQFVPVQAGLRQCSRRLRVVSFNLHFFQEGFSNVLKGSNRATVVGIIQELNADVLLLQELPHSAVDDFASELASMGYSHHVAAGSSDAHVLPADSVAYPSERLHVMVASRLPLLHCEAVPMLDGHAAYAEISLGDAVTGTAALQPYSAHLSVRCETLKRA